VIEAIFKGDPPSALQNFAGEELIGVKRRRNAAAVNRDGRRRAAPQGDRSAILERPGPNAKHSRPGWLGSVGVGLVAGARNCLDLLLVG
jgi:hypothetical protein